jgi:hypothetical protein
MTASPVLEIVPAQPEYEVPVSWSPTKNGSSARALPASKAAPMVTARTARLDLDIVPSPIGDIRRPISICRAEHPIMTKTDLEPQSMLRL